MHQPPTHPHKVGVSLSHGEIVHPLSPLNKHYRLDETIATICLAYLGPDLQITSLDPLTLGRVEGMVGRGFDDLTVNRQVYNDGVFVGPNRRDGIPIEFAGGFVVGKDDVSRF